MERRVTVLIAAAMLASCGGGGGSSGSIGATPTPTPTPAPTPAPTPTPTPTPTSSVSLNYIHVFGITNNDGQQPNGPLLQASDGNFYGTTRSGGGNKCMGFDNFCGAVFRVTPSGEESVLYSFSEAATDTYSPSGGLIQGRDGALYGVTALGGAFGAGALFRITLSGNFSIIYSFGSYQTDGVVPIGNLTQGDDGFFYGATASGGANQCKQIPPNGRVGNCGTIFKVSPAGAEQVLYSFGARASDGAHPNGSLILSSDGTIYGTTVDGGENSCSNTGTLNNCGTIFKISALGQQETIHSFGQSALDGSAPQGPLIWGNDGALYGTTASGGGGRCGSFFGCGTVFRVTTSGSETILYRFAIDSTADGYGPSPQLIFGQDGNFYGTTVSGGSQGGDRAGTVFRLTPAGVKTVLYSFGPLNQNPAAPLEGMIQARDGTFYGVLDDNGTYGSVGARMGSGAIFSMMLK